MSQLWYYKRDGQECGPVTADDLKLLADAQRLLPMDQVRKDGSTRWKPARSVRGLFDDGPNQGVLARAVAIWGTGGIIASGAAVLIVLIAGGILLYALHSSAAATTNPGPAAPTPAVAAAPVPPTDPVQADTGRPWHLLHALREMREARSELKGDDHNAGDRLEDATHALDKAIAQTEKAPNAAGLDPDASAAEPRDYKKYSDHPHLRDALNEILEARVEIKDAHYNFGVERERTLRELGAAADQIESALKFAR